LKAQWGRKILIWKKSQPKNKTGLGTVPNPSLSWNPNGRGQDLLFKRERKLTFLTCEEIKEPCRDKSVLE
jgi:hypothetical protein